MAPDPNIFLWLAASVADVAAVSPNGIKTFLANVWSKIPINGNALFSNDPKSLPKNPGLFYAAEILIILYWMMNLVYELRPSYAENYPYHH